MEDKFEEIFQYAKEQPELIVIEQRKNLIAKARNR
ncbi:hypothetical protein ABID47_002135 [Paenibacillus favisporus]|uniref:Uncharacterized protein n=1 Tax=Paenibacillus favisporus TaxID=221028 RepID=A0ABV2F160_9BACL